MREDEKGLVEVPLVDAERARHCADFFQEQVTGRGGTKTKRERERRKLKRARKQL